MDRLRYETEREPLNHIWARHALFTNYLLAQRKLVEKHRHCAKVTTRYDLAQTPHQRAGAHVLADDARAIADTGFAGTRIAAP